MSNVLRILGYLFFIFIGMAISWDNEGNGWTIFITIVLLNQLVFRLHIADLLIGGILAALFLYGSIMGFIAEPDIMGERHPQFMGTVFLVCAITALGILQAYFVKRKKLKKQKALQHV